LLTITGTALTGDGCRGVALLFVRCGRGVEDGAGRIPRPHRIGFGVAGDGVHTAPAMP
jgi:hypothetical protein